MFIDLKTIFATVIVNMRSIAKGNYLTITFLKAIVLMKTFSTVRILIGLSILSYSVMVHQSKVEGVMKFSFKVPFWEHQDEEVLKS